MAKKPQAVRQVAPELMEELGEPYVRLWKLLCARYSELDAARVLARLVGAIVEHGEQVIAEAISDVLAASPQVRRGPSVPPATVPVPAALQHHQVESTPASCYDALLLGTD